MFFCSYSPYPCNSTPMSTLYNCMPTKLFLCASCIYHMMFIMYIYPVWYRLCTSYLHPADLKQMGPPLCAVVLLKVPS